MRRHAAKKNGKGKWVYVFYPFPAASCSKYSHPEFRIYEKEDLEGQYSFANATVSITYQRHRCDDDDRRECKDGLSYGYAYRMQLQIDHFYREDSLASLMKIVARLSNGMNSTRKILKTLKDLKIERFVEVEVLEDNHYRDRFVPRRFKKTAQLYLDAQKAGYSLAS
jgi:hypothetical protein